MANTNLKISIKEYIRLVEEDSKRAKDGSVYGNLLKNLSDLTDIAQKYYTSDADGKYPTLSAEDYDKLIKGYTTLANSCNEFLKEDRSKNRLETSRINIIKRLASYVGKDLTGLINADKEKQATLSDIVKESRVKTVDLTGKDLGRVGGALSSRIPLKSSSDTEGFLQRK